MSPEPTIPDWRASAPAGISLAAARSAAMNPPKLPGQPITLDRIVKPQAAVRWRGLLAKNYTPERIELILRMALAGDNVSQWALFDLMEDTWPRLHKCLAELKRAVQQLNWQVCPWSEDDTPPSDRAKQQSKVVSKALWKMRPGFGLNEQGFRGMILDIMDAWAKGVVVLEIDWELRIDRALGKFFAPRATRWVHPSCYHWDPPLTQVMLKTGAIMTGALDYPQGVGLVPFPPRKFIIARCSARSGHPLAGALLRPLAFWWAAANFTSEWFLNYVQIFGLPIRWAQYDESKPGLLDKVADMLENMGSAGWGAFPEGTTIELKDGTTGSSQNPHVTMLDRADRQCDLLILGQTLTTDVADSGSRALGDVHASVRTGIIRAAAEWVEEIIQDQVIEPICYLNWGTADEAPEIEATPDEQEDQLANAKRDQILLQSGVQLPKDWFYKRHQIPTPQAGEDVIGSAAPDPAGAAAEEDDATPGQEDQEDQQDGEMQAKAAAPADPVLAIARANAEALGAAYAGAMKPFREAILASTSREDCMKRLAAALPKWDAGRLAAELDRALELCAALGAIHTAK